MAWDLGMGTRKMMESKGLKSVAAPGFQAPGVVVSYTPEPNMFNIFKGKGMQIAAGVPFMINEPAGNFTFRIGLFGLDKVVNKDRTISILEEKLDEILPEIEKAEAEKTA
jgi:aspartate aminotransferase-like enzyme